MSYFKHTFKPFTLLGIHPTRRILQNKYGSPSSIAIRSFSVVPMLSRVLRLRYLFLGSAVGGGVAISNVRLICKNKEK